MNTIHILDSSKAIQPIDDPISFPPINSSRVITPYHSALVLTLCINDFNVHRVLVDLGSTIDLLQLPAFRQMNISFDRLSSTGRILSGFNGATTVTMGDIALPVKVGLVVQQVLFLVVEDLGPIQFHCWTSLVTCDESRALNLPSNDHLPDQFLEN